MVSCLSAVISCLSFRVGGRTDSSVLFSSEGPDTLSVGFSSTGGGSGLVCSVDVLLWLMEDPFSRDAALIPLANGPRLSPETKWYERDSTAKFRVTWSIGPASCSRCSGRFVEGVNVRNAVLVSDMVIRDGSDLLGLKKEKVAPWMERKVEIGVHTVIYTSCPPIPRKVAVGLYPPLTISTSFAKPIMNARWRWTETCQVGNTVFNAYWGVDRIPSKERVQDDCRFKLTRLLERSVLGSNRSWHLWRLGHRRVWVDHDGVNAVKDLLANFGLRIHNRFGRTLNERRMYLGTKTGNRKVWERMKQ